MMEKIFSFPLAVIAFIIISSCSTERSGEERSGVRGEKAMVVSAHPESSKIGVEILRAGGNAIDAAVAVQFALAVCYPEAGNIGGGGFMVYRTADGVAYSLDFRECAPNAARKDMYLDSAGNVIESLSLSGHLACGVPGSVAGMAEAHGRFGSMSWKELLRPAVDLAANGFAVTSRQAARLNEHSASFASMSTQACSWFGREKWFEGDYLLQPELAATLARISEAGSGDFYSGITAGLIVEEMMRGNGLIGYEDLEDYRAVWREPVVGAYGNYRLYSMGLPSSGGIALFQMLGMRGLFSDLPAMQFDPTRIHILSEIQRRVFADRARYMGDPDFIEVPVDALLNPDYLALRAAEISPYRASNAAEIRAGDFVFEPLETTHFSIVDPAGNAVAITTTVNGLYGSHVVVGGAGFFLNNEMDDFSIKPGHPNLFGLSGGQANAIAPGKRMLSSMTPTIVEEDGRLAMVLGSPGGSRIITSVCNVFLNVADLGMGIQQAVDAGRFHHQGSPDILYLEDYRLPGEIHKSLGKLGHNVQHVSGMGAVDAILIDQQGNRIGAADPRGDDNAMGF